MAFRLRFTRPARGRLLVSAMYVSIACLAALTAHASPSLITSVDFTSSPRGHVLVPVSIDGSELLVFVLDTGAGKTLVTPSLVERLGLEKAPGGSTTTLGMHGTTENATVELRSLAVGEAQVADVQAVVLDLDHITQGKWRADGVLGIDFLGQFDIRLDYRASTVSLYSAASDRSNCAACPAGAYGIAFETIDPGFIVLPATVAEKPLKAVLDTGSGHSGLNGKAAAALGVVLPPMSADTPAGHGFGIQTGPVRVGDTVLTERATLHVMNHPVMEALGLADGPTMLMGTDQLEGRTVTICYRLGSLFLQ